MHEPDLMFLDPAAILFYTLCVAGFLCGVRFMDWLFPCALVERKLSTRISPMAFLLTPLILGIAAANIITVYLIKSYPIILLSLLTQQGGDLKNTLAFDVDGHLALVPLALVGITWWALSRYSDLDLQGWKRRMTKSFIFVAVLSVILSSTVTLSRSILMLALAGLAISFLIRRTARGQASAKLIFGSVAAIAVAVPLLFMAFSLLRGAEGWDEQVTTLFGYTVASYNRLAAIVNGRLHYPFSGHGMYLSGAAAHSRLLPLSRLMNLPDSLDVWESEFGAISIAGLKGNLIWSGTFGYIFSELGWFSFPFLFGYGMLYSVVWNWTKRWGVFGVVLYPWFGFCTLFWLGTNYLFDQPAEILLAVALTLAIYERVFVKHPQDTAFAGELKPVNGISTAAIAVPIRSAPF
jgi:hypothetical protein